MNSYKNAYAISAYFMCSSIACYLDKNTCALLVMYKYFYKIKNRNLARNTYQCKEVCKMLYKSVAYFCNILAQILIRGRLSGAVSR